MPRYAKTHPNQQAWPLSPLSSYTHPPITETFLPFSIHAVLLKSVPKCSLQYSRSSQNLLTPRAARQIRLSRPACVHHQAKSLSSLASRSYKPTKTSLSQSLEVSPAFRSKPGHTIPSEHSSARSTTRSWGEVVQRPAALEEVDALVRRAWRLCWWRAWSVDVFC